ncbi:DUF3892 domain-containing protein [Natronospira bacteriovora]|uniref:DUF3892 domain-containing protein n=1 Tax=Natronospira bacteriovora TaxID=3069753 RepID=A0ABU0W743_9GAMM|nr:DUF3892 domain-containing protein [Natronospira sp. AB-CW4]MDQ2069829.1 DUF3892 domain-containing protein [Natronospira sp. AB-CW4]
MEREVTRTRKDKSDGTITALCRPGAPWSPRNAAGAISDIDSGTVKYTAVGPRGNRASIKVVDGPNGKYLRTDWDSTPRNNLLELPDC